MSVKASIQRQTKNTYLPYRSTGSNAIRYYAAVPLTDHHTPQVTLVKEFSEASFRVRRKDFNPKKPWTTEGAVPGTHLVMAVFGCLIYELNQCATTMNDTNISTCAAMIDVCTTYANVKDDFQSSLNALPVKQVTQEAERLKRAEDTRNASKRTGKTVKEDVNSMTTSEDLCATVVKLITNARASETDQTSSMMTAAIMSALEEYEWHKLSGGTLIMEMCASKKCAIFNLLLVLGFNRNSSINSVLMFNYGSTLHRPSKLT